MAVRIGALDAAAGGVDGAHAARHAPVVADAPAIPVITIPTALTVVGTEQVDVGADADQVFVAVLDDQVAVGRVDGDLFTGSPRGGLSHPACPAQHVLGGVDQAVAIAGDH
ncbi:hypothetical protein ASC95_01950 [Pelomonas sp. Root1217]|nr:hypothetical protein ASC95_01950 [Pelomonas sp. Root1217]